MVGVKSEVQSESIASNFSEDKCLKMNFVPEILKCLGASSNIKSSGGESAETGHPVSIHTRLFNLAYFARLV
jgi:hypothetical protein